MTKTLELLQKAFVADPETMRELFQHKASCNSEMVDAELPFVVTEDEDSSECTISVLGLINGILQVNGLPVVAVQTNTYGQTGEEVIVGFCEYTPPQPVAATGKVTYAMPIHQPPTYYWRPCPDITPYELAMCMPLHVAGAARLFDAMERAYKLLPSNMQRHWDLVYTEQAPVVGEWRTFGSHMYCFGMPEAAGDYLWFHPTDGPEKEQLLQNYNGDTNTWGRNTWYRCVKPAEKAAEPTMTPLSPTTSPVARKFNIGCFEAEDMFGNKVWGAAGSDNDEVIVSGLRNADGVPVSYTDAYACLKPWAKEQGIKLKQTTLCVTHDFEKTAGVAIVT